MIKDIHRGQNIKEYTVNIGKAGYSVISLLPLHFNYLNTI